MLGQFKLEYKSKLLELPSRPAQSLFAYLALNPDISHRREKLAGMLWPDSDEENARGYLRQAIWRIRKTFENASLDPEDYLEISRISIRLKGDSNFTLDTAYLDKPDDQRSRDRLLEAVSAYQGELLPGFYDEWIGIERDRYQVIFHKKMGWLIEGLVQDELWDQVLEWAEHWIRHTYASEPAFMAMMRAFAALGNPAMLRTTYERCVEAFNRDLGMEPSNEVQQLFDRLTQQEFEPTSHPPATTTHQPPKEPSFLANAFPDTVQEHAFVARETEFGILDEHLQSMLAGKGKVIFITGEVGSGKTALLDAYTQRSLETHPSLTIASGNCNAHTGMGDPYLPWREILCQLTGDVEGRLEAGAITVAHARRLWELLPESMTALLTTNPGLIGT